ncbi:MAG: hypothetical protein AAGF92_16820 [Myxococcota bacterium]
MLRLMPESWSCRAKSLVCALPLLALLASCGDASQATGEGGQGGTNPPSSDAPLYAVSVRVPGTPVGAFVALVDSLEADTVVDLAGSLEIPNGGLAIGPEFGDAIYVVDGATPRLTKYEVDADGGFEAGETLSTQQFSSSSNSATTGNFIFISETKAYIVDTLSSLIVIWNPASMTITGTIDIGDARIDGFIPLIALQSVFRGSELVFPLAYVSFESAFGPDSSLVFVDTETDTINRIVNVDDCAQIGGILIDDAGDIHAGSGAPAVFNRLSGKSFGTECTVRVPAGTYDLEDYTVFSARTGGASAGELLQQSGTRAYVRVVDESLLDEDAADLGDFNGSQAWRWGLLDLASNEPFRLITSLEPKLGSTTPSRVEGEIWASQGEPDFASTRLVNLSRDEPRVGLEAPGIISNVFRVR